MRQRPGHAVTSARGWATLGLGLLGLSAGCVEPTDDPAPEPAPEATRSAELAAGPEASSPAPPRLAGARFVFRGADGVNHPVFVTNQPLHVEGGRCDEGGCAVESFDVDTSTSLPLLTPIPGLAGPHPASVTIQVHHDDHVVRHTQTVWAIARPEDAPELLAFQDATQGRAPADIAARAKAEAEGAAAWPKLWLQREQARAEAKAGRTTAAAETYEASARWAAELGCPSEAARRLMAAAFHFNWAQRYGQALASAEEAASWAARAGLEELEAEAPYYRGLIELQTGSLLRSYRSSRAALDRLPPWTEPRHRVALNAHVADVEVALGRFEPALDRLANISKQLEDLTRGERAKVTTTTTGVLVAAHLAGWPGIDRPSLLTQYEEIIEIWEEEDNQQSAQLALFFLASAHFLLGEADAAQDHLRAYDARFGSAPFLEADKLRQLRGELALALGEPEVALQRFRHALDRAGAAEELGSSEWVWRAWHGIAQAHVRRDEPKEAARAFEQALRFRAEDAANSPLRAGRDTFLADRLAVVRDAAAFFGARGELERVMQIWDAERAALLASTDALARRSRLSSSEEVELAERLGAYQRAKDAYERGREEVTQLTGAARKEAIAARQAERAALERRFEDIYAYLDEKAPVPSLIGIRPEAVQARLGLDEALVFEIPNPRRFDALDPDDQDPEGQAVWIRASKVELVAASEIAARVLAAASPSPEGGSDRDSAGLGHVYVVASAGSDLAELHTQEMDGAQVLSRVSVSYLPFAGWLQRDPAAASPAALAIIDPEGDLPHAHAEAQALSSVVDGVKELRGPAATRRALLEAADDLGILHFSGHGVLAPTSPWDSHLRLAGNETLTLEDLLIERPTAGLVVLSGCETGARAGRVGLFAFGLAEAFLVVGANTVVATDERVRDEDAAQFMTWFYEADGARRPAEAARKAAQQAQAEGLEVWRHVRVIGRR